MMERGAPRAARLVIIDALADGAEFHLCRDDYFLAETLHDAFDEVWVYTATEGVSAIRAAGFRNVVVRPTVLQSRGARRRVSARLRYILRMLAVWPLHAGEIVLVPAFNELAILLFALLHPRAKLHLVVHYNLSALQSSPLRSWLKRWLMKRTIARADSIIVHTRYAATQVRELSPNSPQSKVQVIRFHQAGVERTVVPFENRRPRISYLGWARADKGLDRFLRLVAGDQRGDFSYGLYGTFELDDEQRALIARVGDRLELVSGYLPDDEYIARFSESMFVVLPYASAYAGSMSGIFCDAISTATPIIASRFEPFTEYAERFGPIGHLVDFERDTIPESVYVRPDRETFDAYQRNLLAARRLHSRAAIRESFIQALQLSGQNRT